jgi:phospholipase C
MKKAWWFKIALIFSLSLSACAPSVPTQIQTTSVVATQTAITVSGDKPCIGAPAPAQWHHIVVLMFENKPYDKVIGPAPYITSLAKQCATVTHWMDADTKVDGSKDGAYNSKSNYATLTSGVSPTVHGLVSDTYGITTNVDNIYHQMNMAGISFKDYYEGNPGGCSIRFSGDYHDALRYYTNVASACNDHDVPLSTFMDDVKSGNLPAFSMLLPSKAHSMHDNSVESGDEYAKSILEPLLNSPAYAKGDVAIFFLWDEDVPVANVLLAPSIAPGTRITVSSGNPISHYSALRTWEDMLGLPLIGDTGSAPSLLPYFNNAG